MCEEKLKSALPDWIFGLKTKIVTRPGGDTLFESQSLYISAKFRCDLGNGPVYTYWIQGEEVSDVADRLVFKAEALVRFKYKAFLRRVVPHWGLV